MEIQSDRAGALGVIRRLALAVKIPCDIPPQERVTVPGPLGDVLLRLDSSLAHNLAEQLHYETDDDSDDDDQ